MGSQHENFYPGLHCSCQTPVEYASSAWSSSARTNLDQLNKTQNAWLRIITSGMKTTPISEMERTAGLLSLEERGEEKLLRQSEKMKRLPSHPLHIKFEANTKNRHKRESNPPGQSAAIQTQDPFISTQPTTGNASKLWGLASRNSNHHPRHPRHPSQGAPHRRRPEVTDPRSP